jgi:hypothetical protein
MLMTVILARMLNGFCQMDLSHGVGNEFEKMCFHSETLNMLPLIRVNDAP